MNKAKIYEFIRYGVVGVMTTGISFLSYVVSMIIIHTQYKDLNVVLSTVISWMLSVTFAYVMNRKYVFRSKAEDWLGEAILFYNSRVVTLIIEEIGMLILVEPLHVSDTVSKVIMQIVIVMINYIYGSWIFNRLGDLDEGQPAQETNI